MKKKIAVIMVGLMVAGGAGSAFAAEALADSPVKTKLAERAQDKKDSITAKIQEIPGAVLVKAREYQEELHAINGLRGDRLELKAQISDKQDLILDLTLAAQDTGDDEALQAAKQVQIQIHALHKENAGLMKAFRADLADFRKADKAENMELAHSELNDAAGVLSEINANLQATLGLLDEMISNLQ